MAKISLQTGQTVTVSHKRGDTDAYPWNHIGVPVEIIAEYPTFYLGVVKPHRSPQGFGMSQPYRITIPKHDVAVGILIIVEEN